MRVRVRIPLLFLQGFAHAWPPKSHFPKANVFMADCAGMCTGAAAHHDEAAMGYDQHHLGCGARGVSARGLRTRRAGDAAHALGTRARRGRGAPVWRRKKKSHHDLGVENPIPLYGMVWLWVPRVLYLLRVPSLVQKQVLRRSGRSARGAVETSALSHLCPRDEGRGTGSDRGFALDLQGSRESRGMGARQTGVATLIPRP